MKQHESWMDDRAETLAFLYLTRRDDLVLSGMRDDYGLNALVYICKDGLLTPRMFGVQVKGYFALPSEATDSTPETLRRDARPIKWHPDQPIPVCFFVFNVRTDAGFYRWLHAPSLTDEEQPELQLDANSMLRPLDRAALDTIVAQVQAWYAAQGHFAEPVVLAADE